MKTRFFIALFIACTTLVVAKTDVFVPQKGFLYPDILEGAGEHRELGGVFTNAARTATSRHHQLKFDTSSDLLGYDRLSLGYLWTWDRETPITFGFGYFGFYTNDIVRTQTNSSSVNGVDVFGTFSDQYTQGVVTMAMPLPHRLAFGSTLRYYGRSLDSHTATAFAGDISLLWKGRSWLEVGAYSRNLLASKQSWDTDEEETLPQAAVVEVAVKGPVIKVTGSSDFTHERLLVDYALSPHLSLIGDGVWDASWKIRRTGVGALLSVGGLHLQYMHLEYNVPGLSVSQDQLGVAFQFSPEQWQGVPDGY